jgi:hypothetical protein
VSSNEVWRLHRSGRVVAELHVTEADFPRLRATLRPWDGFAAVAPLFAEEIRLLDELQDTETPEWAAAYDRIREETRLTYPDGRDVREYLLSCADAADQTALVMYGPCTVRCALTIRWCREWRASPGHPVERTPARHSVHRPSRLTESPMSGSRDTRILSAASPAHARSCA